MKFSAFSQRLNELGALPVHQARIQRAWLQGRSLDNRHSKADDFLPRVVREALPALAAEFAALVRVREEVPGADGSIRLLLDLADGQSVESVLLPGNGLCVSTQVGCAVGCRFCMTGRSGLLRQVGSAEILAQFAAAQARRPVRRVVFMGMGEPAHNLDNVMEAIDLLGTFGGIGHKNLVFSTVGDPRVFERLPLGPVKPALALSLHSSRDALRAELLPRAPRMTPEELVERGEIYARTTGYPIQYQWTLLRGVNDNLEEMDGIVRLLAGKYAIMNLIPYNAVSELPYARPDAEHARALVRYLMERRILTKIRQSAGQDVDAGCGQLRARHIPLRKTQRDSSPRLAPT